MILALVMATSLPVGAKEPDAGDVETARFEFAEGNSQFQAKHWAEALKAFEHSHSLVASPNTELMIARCLRELGRRGEAAQAYLNAASEANRRVAKGEAKYSQTVEAATIEGNALKDKIGTLQIRVQRPNGITMTVDKKTIPLSKDGDATLLRDPGSVVVTVTDANGVEQRQTVSVSAGTTVQMEFGGSQSAAPKEDPKQKGTPSPPPASSAKPETKEKAFPSPAPSERGWATPAAIAAGSLTAVGLGLFIGFGASSQATYDKLVQECGAASRCGESYRDEADEGARNQSIANVSLGVAAVAAVATVVFVVMSLRGDRPPGR